MQLRKLSKKALLAAFGIAVIFGCSKAKSPDLEANRVVVGIESNPVSFDPRLATGAKSIRINALIYSGLLRMGTDALPEPDLAETWEMNDETTYTFHLRKGVKAHDGGIIDARDVAFTFRSILDKNLKSAYRSDFEVIKSIETPDNETVVIKLKRPHAPFLTNMMIGIIPERAKDRDIAREPLGSGPFKFESWDFGSEVHLTAFEDYYGGAPSIKTVIFKVVPNDVTRALEMLKGEVDILENNLPLDYLKEFSGKPGIRIITSPGISYSYIGFNLKHEALAKKPVREAIAHAIDRHAVIDYMLAGTGEPATGLLSPRNWAYDPEVRTYKYDPELSKRLLDKAGYPDPDGDGPEPRLKLTFKTSTNRERIRIVHALAAYLKKVGIEVKVLTYEWGTFYADIKSGNYELMSLSWVGITEPDIYRYVFHTESFPPAGANRTFYNNPEIDRLTDLGRITVDKTARKKIYSSIQKILAQDLPYVSLWYNHDVVVMDDRIQGFEIRPGGDYLSLKDARLRSVPK